MVFLSRQIEPCVQEYVRCGIFGHDNNLETLEESRLKGNYYTDTHVIDLFERVIGNSFLLLLLIYSCILFNILNVKEGFLFGFELRIL